MVLAIIADRHQNHNHHRHRWLMIIIITIVTIIITISFHIHTIIIIIIVIIIIIIFIQGHPGPRLVGLLVVGWASRAERPLTARFSMACCGLDFDSAWGLMLRSGEDRNSLRRADENEGLALMRAFFRSSSWQGRVWRPTILNSPDCIIPPELPYEYQELSFGFSGRRRRAQWAGSLQAGSSDTS